MLKTLCMEGLKRMKITNVLTKTMCSTDILYWIKLLQYIALYGALYSVMYFISYHCIAFYCISLALLVSYLITLILFVFFLYSHNSESLEVEFFLLSTVERHIFRESFGYAMIDDSILCQCYDDNILCLCHDDGILWLCYDWW